jgi:hypothetical protein
MTTETARSPAASDEATPAPAVAWRIGPFIAILISVLAFLPIANWLPGGHSAPWYAYTLDTWLSGTTIVVGVGIVAAILSRRATFLWRWGLADGLIAFWSRRPIVVTLIVTAGAFAAYLAVALFVLGGRPLLIDEIVEVFHAQIFVGGALSHPVFAYPEFFSSMHVVDTQGKVYSQFPAGGPAMLALGVLVHAPWIVGPAFGAIAVVAFASFARSTEESAGTALAATVLFAFAPFVLFMSGSHMNHVTSLAWIIVGIAAMAGVFTSDEPRPALAMLSGLGFGIAATIRPVDALAFAAPAGLWYLARALREPRRWKDAIPAGVGVAVPMCALMWVNSRTTGAPLLFGYELLWGDSHRLGFHSAPWGMSHTPTRGLELVNVYLLQLQTYFLDTPVPSLLPAIVVLALSRRLKRFDRYLLASAALIVGFYFAYWHNGFYLGPRFMYPLMVPLAIWTARFLPVVRARCGTGLIYRTAVYGSVCAVAIAAVVNLPIRTRYYSNGLLTMRWNADSSASASKVENALVLVRESWGAQLVSRLWALDVPRSETELFYRRIDACRLESAVERLEDGNIRGASAVSALRPLLQDSTELVGSPFSPDTTEQFLPGSTYSRRCLSRINEDRAGFTLFTPLLLAHGGNNVYARDLHGRDTLLIRSYSERPLYLLKPASAEIGEPPRFYPLSRDSLEHAWRDPNR